MEIPVLRLDTVDSTNRYVKQGLLDKRLSGAGMVVSRIQTCGMGTHGRDWRSDNDLGLWATLYFSPCPLPAFALVMAVSVSVVEALETLGLSTGIKWPNDVIVNRKKICGILAETLPGGALVGLGVNLNQGPPDFPADLRSIATSFRMEKGAAFPPPDFIPLFLDRFRDHFLSTDIPARYRLKLAVLDEPMFLDGRPVIIADVAEDGALLARHEDGVVRKHYSGRLAWGEHD